MKTAANGSSTFSSREDESGVRLTNPGRYRVEYARIVEDATILDFHPDCESDDLDECVERAAELRREHGSCKIAVLVLDEESNLAAPSPDGRSAKGR